MARAMASAAAGADPARPLARPAPGAAPRPRPSSVPPRRRAGAPHRSAASGSTAAPSRPLVSLPSLPAARRASEEILDRLLRGHGWIVCIGVLLVGIVFLNVRLLELDGGIARDSERVSSLRQDNGGLRLRAAHLGSSERIQRAAAARGLVWPEPGKMRYVRMSSRDAALAATRVGPPRAVAAAPATPGAGQPVASAAQSAPPGSAGTVGAPTTAPTGGQGTAPGATATSAPGATASTPTGGRTSGTPAPTTTSAPAASTTPDAGATGVGQ